MGDTKTIRKKGALKQEWIQCNAYAKTITALLKHRLEALATHPGCKPAIKIIRGQQGDKEGVSFSSRFNAYKKDLDAYLSNLPLRTGLERQIEWLERSVYATMPVPAMALVSAYR